MQVFKTYFRIMKKKMFTIAVYGGLFLLLTIMFINNSETSGNTFETEKVSVMVINEDGQNGFLTGFLDYLGEYVNYVEPEEGKQAIQDALYFRKVSYILTIPKGFTKSFQENKALKLAKQTAPNTIEAVTIDQAIESYFNIARIYESYMPGISGEELNTYVKDDLSERTKVQLATKKTDRESASNAHYNVYFNFLGYIMIAIFIVSISTIMFSFHGLDIRRKQAASPMSYRNMNAQLLLANAVFVLCYLVVFLVAGVMLNDSKVLNMNVFLFWINAFTFSIVVLSISYLIGISVSSRKAISALSTGLSLGLSFLSGMFVPQKLLGAPVLKVASFTPTYWFVKANDTIGTIGSCTWTELSRLAGYMGIQLGFAAAIISIALVISKRKRQQEY